MRLVLVSAEDELVLLYWGSGTGTSGLTSVLW